METEQTQDGSSLVLILKVHFTLCLLRAFDFLIGVLYVREFGICFLQ